MEAAVVPVAAVLVAMPRRKKMRRRSKRRRWKPLLLICLAEMTAETTKDRKGKRKQGTAELGVFMRRSSTTVHVPDYTFGEQIFGLVQRSK